MLGGVAITGGIGRVSGIVLATILVVFLNAGVLLLFSGNIGTQIQLLALGSVLVFAALLNGYTNRSSTATPTGGTVRCPEVGPPVAPPARTPPHTTARHRTGGTMTVLDTFSLAGRNALVTGGNRGLGLAFVRGLAEAGARVVIGARDEQKNQEAIDLLRAEGHEVHAVAVDITQDADVDRMVEFTGSTLGGVDVLVNNAGIAIHRPALEVPDDEWDAVLNLNLRALWKVSTATARHMKEAGGGNIINIGSISSIIVNRPQWQPAYNASKAAVHQLTKSLAAEWARDGIRVNALAPGYVKTEMAPVDRPEFRRYWIEDAAQQRYATPEEIAPTLVYLASDASAFMTGSVVVIDGGYTLY